VPRARSGAGGDLERDLVGAGEGEPEDAAGEVAAVAVDELDGQLRLAQPTEAGGRDDLAQRDGCVRALERGGDLKQLLPAANEQRVGGERHTGAGGQRSVQRQRLPASPSRMSARSGSGFFSSKCTAARIIPGVQMPHCAPPHSRNASCKGFIKTCVEIPSMVMMFASVRLPHRNETTIHQHPVQQNGTRTALSLAASFFGAR